MPPPPGHDEAVPAPRAHALLAALSIAPALFPVPASLNIVATAAAAVYVGCWRSVKKEAPVESMSRKVGGGGGGGEGRAPLRGTRAIPRRAPASRAGGQCTAGTVGRAGAVCEGARRPATPRQPPTLHPPKQTILHRTP